MIRLLPVLLIVGCAGNEGALLSQQPIETFTLNGSYQRLADCSYDKIKGAGAPAVQRTELPTQKKAIVALDTGQVRYWEASFIPISASTTSVSVSSASTLVGPYPTSRVIEAIRSCEGA